MRRHSGVRSLALLVSLPQESEINTVMMDVSDPDLCTAGFVQPGHSQNLRGNLPTLYGQVARQGKSYRQHHRQHPAAIPG